MIQTLTPEEQAALIEAEIDRVDQEIAHDIIHPPKPEGSILDPRLPHRFGNRAKRRKLQSQIRKLK